MLRIGHSRAFLSSVLPGPSLLPCRSYFRTPCLAAKKHRPQPRSKPAAFRPNTNPSPVPPIQSEEPVFEPEPPQEDLRGPHSARNHLLFAGGVVFNICLWAAFKTNTDTDHCVERITHGRDVERLDNSILSRARSLELAQTLRKWGALITQKTQSLPQIPQTAIRESYAAVAQKYFSAPDVLKVCWWICAFNGAVFLASKIPRLTGFMARNFVHRPLSGKSWTHVTSVFAHMSVFHLLVNCMALNSFGVTVGHYLDEQQAQGASNRLESTAAYHFLAFFISAGLFSSLASHMVRTRLYDRVVARLSPLAQGSRPYLPGSLGASGAVYATVTLTALAYPHLGITPIFLNLNIPIPIGVGALVLFDVIGFFRGWRVIDHVAHLGGAVFGAWYYLYGPRLWDLWREFAGYMFDDKSKHRQRTA
ncbi:hypothetical protein DFH09DRAFT_1137486 [Mycena vulgaris]|nr:hypothetical protein DFH09DRAFT_1137486 [Mycena vulgaris]